MNVLAVHAEETGNVIQENSTAVWRAQKLVIKQFGDKFGKTAIRQRYSMLKNRHIDFAHIILMCGVYYDAEANVLTATDTTWKEIFQVIRATKFFTFKELLSVEFKI